MKLKAKIIAPAVVIIVFGGIAITAALNLWNTRSDRTPMRYRGGEFEGEFDPGDIRGSYSFDDGERAFEIPVDVLAAAFGMNEWESPGSIRVKEIEATFGSTGAGEIGTDSLRYFVSLYTGLPYTPENHTLLPVRAFQVLGIQETTLELPRRLINGAR